MAKSRSPNYPAVSLPEAIDRTRKVYERDYMNDMPPEVVAQHLGYTSLNGASLTMISALKKYGLLDGRGDSVRVTKSAQAILEDMDEAVEAAVNAAFLPALWAEIESQFGGEVPSETNLRAFLLRRGFNPGKVGGVIKNYIDTVEFIRAFHPQSANVADAAGSAPVSEGGKIVQLAENAGSIATSPEDAQVMILPMGKDFVAKVTFSGEVTKKRLAKLVSFVQLAMDDYPDEPAEDPEVQRVSD